VSSKQQQADSEIHEDQLLNFLVNGLDEEVALDLANNTEISAEDIYKVLVAATADGTSISTLCNSSEDSPPANTILYHLRTKFELFRLERVANTLLRRDVVELLPEQVEVCSAAAATALSLLSGVCSLIVVQKDGVEKSGRVIWRRFVRY
jgi:ABC-type uncharacterized transport system permease subunit